MDERAKCLYWITVMGLCFLFIGLIMSIGADCEVLEVVVVQTILPVAHGIGLCEATFAYHPHTSAPITGALITTCPIDKNKYSDVAVCYAVARPDKYKAALLASDLTVTQKSVWVGWLIAGSTVLGCMMLAEVILLIAARRGAARRNRDDLPLLSIVSIQPMQPDRS